MNKIVISTILGIQNILIFSQSKIFKQYHQNVTAPTGLQQILPYILIVLNTLNQFRVIFIIFLQVGGYFFRIKLHNICCLGGVLKNKLIKLPTNGIQLDFFFLFLSIGNMNDFQSAQLFCYLLFVSFSSLIF